MVVKNQSTSESAPTRAPRPAAAAAAAAMGGVTNWNRIVMSASVIFPRERSSSGSAQLAPFFWILPVCLSCASEMISLPTAMRASMPVREVRDVLVAAHLEEQPVARQRLRRDDEHVLRRLPDRDVLALADQALLDDSSALNDPDAQDLGLREPIPPALVGPLPAVAMREFPSFAVF